LNYLMCDNIAASDLDRLFDTVKAKAGRLDILVTSSGVSEYSTLDSTTEEHFDKEVANAALFAGAELCTDGGMAQV
jgi:NAD(P)-dependent dehydrogenase (short-subunit alcohol dehydrogenase family)